MLSLFRRHLKSCPHSSRRYRRCACPISVEGSLGGEIIRKALDLTSWEAAENLIHQWTASGRIGGSVAHVATIEEATTLFLAEAESRSLAPESMRMYRRFVGRQLVAWAKSKGYRYVKELTFVRIIEFKASWQYAPSTAAKRLELVKAFMKFCVAAGWIEKNPAETLRPPKSKTPPTLPFTDSEMTQILEACDRYTTHGDHGKTRPERVKAFVLLLRYSGLRIQDAACLATVKLRSDDSLMLYTQKTGVPVCVPLPPGVASLLRKQAARNTNKDYVFWTGNGSPESAVSSWQRTLRTLFTLAGVKAAHAHRFRDTFAVALLESGSPLEDVQILLGHSSIRVTEKHYAPWVQSRQVKLEERVRATWSEAPRLIKLVV